MKEKKETLKTESSDTDTDLYKFNADDDGARFKVSKVQEESDRARREISKLERCDG